MSKLGRPQAAICKRGHIRTKTKNGSCKECEKNRLAARYDAQRDEILIRTRELQTEQRRNKGILPRRVGLDPEKLAQNRRRASKIFRERNPGEANAYARLRQTRRDQRTPAWTDLEKIKTIYKIAKQRQRDLGVRMAVDHIVPLKGEVVSGLHVHENLRIIPYIENAQKSNSYQCA